MTKLFQGALLAVVAVALTVPAYAGDLNSARNTVDNIREADPPSVSTTTKESPVGQPASDYRPQQRPLNITEPPSPVSKYNPTNDPDVERGYREHQQQYGH